MIDSQLRAMRREQLRKAAERLRSDYLHDSELTAFSVLDGEAFDEDASASAAVCRCWNSPPHDSRFRLPLVHVIGATLAAVRAADAERALELASSSWAWRRRLLSRAK